MCDLPAAMDFNPLVPVCPIMDLFTDGSCLYPSDPDIRMAAYSVIASQSFSLDFDSTWFTSLVAQVLPGLIQTTARAELMAVVTALQFAVQYGHLD